MVVRTFLAASTRWPGHLVLCSLANMVQGANATQPLLPAQAVQVSLLEQPKLSYGLIIQGGDVSFLPNFEGSINCMLRKNHFFD